MNSKTERILSNPNLIELWLKKKAKEQTQENVLKEIRDTVMIC